MIKGGLILTTGNLAAALLSLVRNIIIARLISVEDFGIASTFAITMAMVEMASTLSLDRLVVQARDGDDSRVLATLHSIQALRGALGAGILFVAAAPLAALFGLADVAWAYQALAAVPLLRGLAHLDMFRRQRALQFLPAVTVETTAQLLSSVAALPLAFGLGDYRAMLFALLIQQLIFAAASHFVAIQPYRWGWDRDVVRRAFLFGWPLLLNGFLLFGIFQGDRIIVGSLIGMTELGWFSVAFSLTFIPGMVLATTAQSFFLPQLARLQDDAAGFHRLWLVTLQATVLLGVLLAVAIALVGPTLLVLLYGAKYEPAVSILVWLAVMQGLRLARIGISTAATSRANTTNPLLGNMVRVLALPVAWASVSMGGGMVSVVGIAIVGEAIAFVISLLLLRRTLALRLARTGVPIIAGAAAFVLVGVQAWGRGESDPMFSDWLHVATITAALVMLWSMRELRVWIRNVPSGASIGGE